MDKIAIDLGFVEIYWYSITMFLGILVGALVMYQQIKKHKINQDFFINLIFYGIIFALIGARSYYVLFNLDYYLKNPIEIFKIWNGGLAIHGGIIAGVIWFIFYTKKYKQNTFKILDMASVGLIIGQAIGRWGNFFNQEAFGGVVLKQDLINAKVPNFIIDQMYINGNYRQPTFLYESIWNLFGFLALLIIRKYKYLKTGQLTGFYLMWYSLGRFVIEGFRTDSLMIGSFKIAKLVSIILFVIGFLLFVLRKKKGGRFANLYHEEENNEIRF